MLQLMFFMPSEQGDAVAELLTNSEPPIGQLRSALAVGIAGERNG
jgi:hypothetical protein